MKNEFTRVYRNGKFVNIKNIGEGIKSNNYEVWIFLVILILLAVGIILWLDGTGKINLGIFPKKDKN